MELLNKNTVEIQTPDQALIAWSNGRGTIEALRLSEREQLESFEQNDYLLRDLIIEKVFSFEWTARAFYNAIEEYYPVLSTDASQKATRKVLMGVLQNAMSVIEERRLDTIIKSVDIL